ncbi:hypothetical protein [Nocardia blacklockiae]|uniref:hypothetical protein n=1 Tax=Nocardia blacklockiae TaxID=480036 RepID=UPI00189324A3|nr:hypothetical protein [Nocardia blacklockiae]MBF6176028.1 hypothetical protein [Nocardia blacklockiae]
MTPRYGYGKNQRKVLWGLRDGVPRTCAEVAAGAGLRKQVVINTMNCLDGHKLVAATGERGKHSARKWVITTAGSDLIDRTADSG